MGFPRATTTGDDSETSTTRVLLHEAHWEACVLALACIALLLGLLGILSVILYDVYGRMKIAQEEKEKRAYLWNRQMAWRRRAGSLPPAEPFMNLYDSVSIGSMQHCM